MLIPGYTKEYKIETVRSRKEILEDLQKDFRNVEHTGDEINIRYTPSSFFFWAGRGRIHVHLTSQSDGRNLMDCRFTPWLFYFDLSQFLFLLLLGLFSFAMTRTALTFDSIIWMVLAWLAIILIAPYLMMLLVVAGTLLMLLSYNYFALASMIMAWLLTWLIVSLVLAYNRKRLEERFFRALRDQR